MYSFPSWSINTGSGPTPTSFEKKTSDAASLSVLVSSIVTMKRQPQTIFSKDHSLSLLPGWPRDAEIAVGSLGYPKLPRHQQCSAGAALLSSSFQLLSSLWPTLAQVPHSKLSLSDFQHVPKPSPRHSVPHERMF